MSQRIEVGFGTKTVAIDVDDSVTIIGQTSTGQKPVPQPTFPCDDADDAIIDAVADALKHPLAGIGIEKYLMPGDRFAIALEPGLPRPDLILRGVEKAVEACEPSEIRVVVSGWAEAIELQRLHDDFPESMELSIHHLGHRNHCRYLGADEEAEPIRLSSELVDSDFVLPIGLMRLSDPISGGAQSDALYPAMTDDNQWKRLMKRVVKATESPDRPAVSWANGKAQQIRWALGIHLMLAVDIGPLGTFGGAIAGSHDQIIDTLRARSATPSATDHDELADVTVLCIEGDAAQQSVTNVARVAMIGRALTNPGGAVVIIADTDHLDPTSIAAFASDTNTDPTDHDHEHDHEHDQHDPSHHEHEPADSDNESITTQPQFARELLGDLVSSFDPSRRYLLWSNCKAETIESLGLGVIDGANSLSKLINQNPRCRIIRVAQLATPPTH